MLVKSSFMRCELRNKIMTEDVNSCHCLFEYGIQYFFYQLRQMRISSTRKYE